MDGHEHPGTRPNERRHRLWVHRVGTGVDVGKASGGADVERRHRYGTFQGPVNPSKPDARTGKLYATMAVTCFMSAEGSMRRRRVINVMRYALENIVPPSLRDNSTLMALPMRIVFRSN